MRSVIEENLRRKVEGELGPSAWPALLAALDEEAVDEADPGHELSRFQRSCTLAAERLRRNRSALLLELGLDWWKAISPTTSTDQPRAARIRSLTDLIRSSRVLLDLGLVPMPNQRGDPKNAIILHHTQPIPGCRSFVFGVLHGVGRGHRILVDVRLLEPHELNGLADIIAVEIG